ncbi:MAG: 16S rRNA (adenine(1518)-N(6)/adenine(1519)-N(6))-dimethyltransferase RsmA [Bacteroidota bacterium]
MKVRAKKSLGQHFLKDLDAAQKIVESLTAFGGYENALEIGPGMGVLTQYLMQRTDIQTTVVELDRESVDYLKLHFKNLPSENILSADFLKLDLSKLFSDKKFGIIGNFPYNISSQIFFKVLENKHLVNEVVCMLQKEVAVRIASGPGKKDYGILSVLLQAFYDIEYCFSVGPEAFIPPPKVNSGIIRLTRNTVTSLDCDEKLFFSVVKMGFNQRRKTLRNALRALQLPDNELLDKRAEQLSVADFVVLTKMADASKDKL